MISATYANNILNYLLGRQNVPTNSTFLDNITTTMNDRTLDESGKVKKIYSLMNSYMLQSTTTPLYLGLTANAPNTSGKLENEGEPKIDTETNYARFQIKEDGLTQNDYFSSSSNGQIKNSQEIKFQVATSDWGQMNYWFLTPSANGIDNIILWGSIKDVIQDNLIVTADRMDTYNTVVIEIPDLIQLRGETKYTITWDENGKTKEIDVQSGEKFTDENSNICVTLSNIEEDFGPDNPIRITHWITGNPEDGFITHYKIESYDTIDNTYSIHGYGINVKKNTVPTFFSKQLIASIDLNKE